MKAVSLSSLIRIVIRGSRGDDTYAITSKLWMVDLGGSERILKTGASGQTMEEAKAINLSLSALGDVISALQKKQPHIPYRYLNFEYQSMKRFLLLLTFLMLVTLKKQL